MRTLIFLTATISIIYLSCGNTNKPTQPFKLITNIRDSACQTCMPWYIDSFPKMGDDSVLGMWANFTNLPDGFQAEEIGTPHEREEVIIYIYIKRGASIIKYRYDISRRKFALYTYFKPLVNYFDSSQIKRKGDYFFLNYDKSWDSIYSDFVIALDFKHKKFHSANSKLLIKRDDTTYYTDRKGRPFIRYTLPINSVKEILLPLWQYSQQCAKNDTNTLGRWYGPISSCIRIFKQGSKYYEMWYNADGSGDIHEVQLEAISNGIKVIPVFKAKELALVYHHYKVIDFNNNFMLKHYIGSKHKLDDSFYHEPCYKYCEAETDSMFYYGYDTLSPLIQKIEPILFGAED
jgi:hypothetical protein